MLVFPVAAFNEHCKNIFLANPFFVSVWRCSNNYQTN